METIIKYTAIDLRGKVITFNHIHECPEFKFESGTINSIHGVINYVSEINCQIIDWLDEQDKMDIIYKYDLTGIVEYEVFTEVIEETVSDIIQQFDLSDKLKFDFALVYHRLKDSISNLTPYEQISVVFNSLGFAYDASSASYDHICRILKGESEIESDMKEILTIK